ncbi:MAG: hypothetical protein GY841_18750 [FCB group bacterium]|nr:hypothetical protein [FCB group bacterium]
MKNLIGLILCLALFMFSACTTIHLDAQSLLEPVQMNAAGAEDYSVISSFVVNDKAGWVWIVPVNKPAGDLNTYLAAILENQIQEAGGDGVINVKIRMQNQVVDYLTLIGTLGFYATRTVTITGDVIKYD